MHDELLAIAIMHTVNGQEEVQEAAIHEREGLAERQNSSHVGYADNGDVGSGARKTARVEPERVAKLELV